MGLLDTLNSKVALGVFSKTIDSAFIESTGLAGMDFVIIDMEHGSISLESLHHHVRAANCSGIAPIVRVPTCEPSAICSALDSGAEGVQVPNINNAVQAKKSVEAAKFHPQGNRGVCRFVRAANYGNLDKNAYFKNANKRVVILQVEGMEGIANLDEILKVQGFDVLFIGPYDLSQSVGKPGDVDSPEVIEQMRLIAAKAKAQGILLGAFCDTHHAAKLLKAEGFVYIAYSVDVNIYLEACKKLKDEIL